MRLTEEQKSEIRRQRVDGAGYKTIANGMGLSVNTVISHCRRNGLTGRARKKDGIQGCKWCGRPVQQTLGRKEKKFCSDECRIKWWNRHHNQPRRNAWYEFTCQCCGKPFRAYGNDHRKYCSHDCYIKDRFGDRRIKAAANKKRLMQESIKNVKVVTGLKMEEMENCDDQGFFT